MVKPADAEERRAKKRQAAQPRAKSLFHVSQPKCGESNPLKNTKNDPCPLRAPGSTAETGIQMRALYAAICSRPLHAAPPMMQDCWTPTLIICGPKKAWHFQLVCGLCLYPEIFETIMRQHVHVWSLCSTRNIQTLR